MNGINLWFPPQEAGLTQNLGIRVVLSAFSPLAGTPDGEYCRRWVDLGDPLWHNKTAVTMRRLGQDEVARLKNQANRLNLRLQSSNSEAIAPILPVTETPRHSNLEKLF